MPDQASDYLIRFSRTERAVHWIHASAFFVLLGSGLVLYLPVLAEAVSRRPLVKAVHVNTAIAWGAALVLVVLAGDRRGARRALGELDAFDRDDLSWLRGSRAPQGRFNAGQKLHAIVTAAIAVLFAVSGALLWYGERDTRFRLPGTIALHDALTYLSVVLVLGHLYLAVIHPATRHALHGITVGTVRRSWAEKHHAKWAAASTSAPAARSADPRSDESLP